MSSAFAPTPFEVSDDEFDLDMDFAADAGGSPVGSFPEGTAGDINPREPLQFTSPAEAAATVPAVAGFNPVGELVAGASAAFSAPVPSGPAGGPGIGEVSVPRIAIHVFAERQDTLASAERAGQDRRLSRATTQIRIGGVAAAVEAYQHEPTPPLIIVECLTDPDTLLREVDLLA